jgi:uncharacterized protein YjeT (DUF2065 family)
MDISVNFAMFFCLYFFSCGLALLFNPKVFSDAVNDFLNSRGQMLLGGIMALMLGSFVVSFHGYYELNWPILITIIGWISFLKGVVYLLAPQYIQGLAKFYQTSKALRINGVVCLVLGLFFLYLLNLDYSTFVN